MKLKLLGASAAVLIALGLLVFSHPRLSNQTAPAGQTTSFSTRHTPAPRLPAPRLSESRPQFDSSPESVSHTNLLTLLLKGEDLPKLRPEQVQSYLDENHRSVGSLLAAFQATDDRTLLEEAMEKYPTDPRLDYVAWRRSQSPEEGRQWLDAFKQSAPDNALANYLSARDYFKSGQNDQAVQELSIAATKPIQDYSLDFVQNADEAYRAAGYSEAEAKMIATSTLLLPQFAEYKGMGINLVELANTYRQSGDGASAQAALQMATSLGQRLDNPGSLTILQSLVGIAIQRIVLNSMDPGSTYGDTGQTVQSQIDSLAQRREAIKAVAQQTEKLLTTMPEQDLLNYFDRMKVFGEEAAIRWAASKYGP
jgi:tetratricopeptide (TPR) repeat protein